jgi:SAM-dependent methyltransferase
MLTHAQGPRVQAELTQAPFRAGTFRLVLSVTALIDYADARPAVAEIRRLLAPEGWLALSVLKREDIVGLEAALERAGLPVLERLDLEQDFGFIARKS